VTDQTPTTGRPYVLVEDFFKALHQAGLLPQYPMVSRIVIDADVAKGLVNMYVDQVPSGALLSIAPLVPPPAGARP